MKGFLQGSLWALVLGGTGLSVASLVGEQPNFAEGPAAPQLSVPALDTVAPGPAVAFEGSNDEAPQFTPAAPLDETTELSEAAPEVSTAPAALPQAADVAAAIEAPGAVVDLNIGSSIDAPNAPRLETALVAPTQEADEPAVDTDPAEAQAAPQVEEVLSEPVAAEDAIAIEDAVEPASGQVVAEEVTAAEEPAEQPIITITPQEVPEADVVEEPVVAATAEPIEGDQSSSAQLETTEGADTSVAAEASVEAPETTADEAPALTQDSAAQQDTVVVAEALPQTNAAVRINRPGTTEEEPPVEVEAAPEADVIADDAPALLRYAVPFAQDEATALISVILVDDGQMQNGPAAVAELGFVTTVALNALSSASTDLATAYRAAGVEIAMQAALPEGAQPTDVEVAFEAAMGLVPEVAMLFSDGTGAMQDRAVTAQVMEILASDGHGFVAVQRGLSNAARAADQAGVSAATIERDIDGEGEDSRAILRALDQAAFRARQTGEAVLLGRVTPETLQALRQWAADLDRETLAIAPVSAVLLRGEGS